MHYEVGFVFKFALQHFICTEKNRVSNFKIFLHDKKWIIYLCQKIISWQGNKNHKFNDFGIDPILRDLFYVNFN